MPKGGAAAVLAIAALLSVLIFVRVPGTGAWLRASLDASHGPIFAGITVLLVVLMKPSGPSAAWPDWRRCGKALVVSVTLGALIEFLQYFQDRPPSLSDVMTDTAGALAGLAVWALASRRESEQGPRGSGAAILTVIALGLIGVAFILWRPVQAARAYAHRATVFPVIAEFSDPVGLQFVGAAGAMVEIVEMPRQWAREPGERTLAVHHDLKQPQPVMWIEPSPDWRGYSVIAMDITNPAPTPITLAVRTLDHDCYWLQLGCPAVALTVASAARVTVRVAIDRVSGVPEYRPLDMSRIVHLRLIGDGAAVPAEFYVSRIWLE